LLPFSPSSSLTLASLVQVKLKCSELTRHQGLNKQGPKVIKKEAAEEEAVEEVAAIPVSEAPELLEVSEVSEISEVSAAPPPPLPSPTPPTPTPTSTATSTATTTTAEAATLAACAAEGLTLAVATTASGYRNVRFVAGGRGGGRGFEATYHGEKLGKFPTAMEAALAVARKDKREAAEELELEGKCDRILVGGILDEMVNLVAGEAPIYFDTFKTLGMERRITVDECLGCVQVMRGENYDREEKLKVTHFECARPRCIGFYQSGDQCSSLTQHAKLRYCSGHREGGGEIHPFERHPLYVRELSERTHQTGDARVKRAYNHATYVKHAHIKHAHQTRPSNTPIKHADQITLPPSSLRRLCSGPVVRVCVAWLAYLVCSRLPCSPPFNIRPHIYFYPPINPRSLRSQVQEEQTNINDRAKGQGAEDYSGDRDGDGEGALVLPRN